MSERQSLPHMNTSVCHRQMSENKRDQNRRISDSTPVASRNEQVIIVFKLPDILRSIRLFTLYKIVIEKRLKASLRFALLLTMTQLFAKDFRRSVFINAKWFVVGCDFRTDIVNNFTLRTERGNGFLQRIALKHSAVVQCTVKCYNAYLFHYLLPPDCFLYKKYPMG